MKRRGACVVLYCACTENVNKSMQEDQQVGEMEKDRYMQRSKILDDLPNLGFEVIV